MSAMNASLLLPFARKYIWWKSPEEAVTKPLRVIAQVMELGDYEDAQTLIKLVGKAVFVEALKRSEAGQLSARSWHYWHLRLGLADFESVPPLPVRRFDIPVSDTYNV